VVALPRIELGYPV